MEAALPFFKILRIDFPHQKKRVRIDRVKTILESLIAVQFPPAHCTVLVRISSHASHHHDLDDHRLLRNRQLASCSCRVCP